MSRRTILSVAGVAASLVVAAVILFVKAITPSSSEANLVSTDDSTETIAEESSEQTQQKAPGIVVVSDEVLNFLGEDLIHLIMNCDVVHAFAIVPTKSDAKPNVNGYPVLKQYDDLSSDQLQELRQILLDHRTYDFKLAKRHPFIPTHAFLLSAGSEQPESADSALLLISPSGLELKFEYAGRELIEDYDVLTPNMTRFLNDVFPVTTQN